MADLTCCCHVSIKKTRKGTNDAARITVVAEPKVFCRNSGQSVSVRTFRTPGSGAARRPSSALSLLADAGHFIAHGAHVLRQVAHQGRGPAVGNIGQAAQKAEEKQDGDHSGQAARQVNPSQQVDHRRKNERQQDRDQHNYQHGFAVIAEPRDPGDADDVHEPVPAGVQDGRQHCRFRYRHAFELGLFRHPQRNIVDEIGRFRAFIIVVCPPNHIPRNRGHLAEFWAWTLVPNA